jgi:ribosomal protein S27E
MVRCEACGHVQWALLGTPELCDCPACGRPLKAERRHPGRRFLHGKIRTERRGRAERPRDSPR